MPRTCTVPGWISLTKKTHTPRSRTASATRETPPDAVVNLPSRSRTRTLNWRARRGSGRIGGNAQDVHGPGLDLHDEEDTHTAEQHGIDMREVAGQPGVRHPGPRLPACRYRAA